MRHLMTELLHFIEVYVLSVIIVPAAGNQDDDACVYSPGRVPTVLTVGGINVDDTSMSYSNYGSCVDIYAPGEWILSTCIGGESEFLSGTSMAAPHLCVVATCRYIHTFDEVIAEVCLVNI